MSILKTLSDDQLAILANWSVGHAEAARSLGFDRARVRSLRRKMGVEKLESNPQKIEWTPEMDALIATASPKDAAAQFGIHPASVLNRMRKIGLPFPAKKPTSKKLTKCPHCGKEL